MMFFGSESKEKGFTLLELLISLAIGLIVLAGIYSLNRSQQKSHLLQEQVAGMQQNIRAAMYFMTREIRMCGCNPTGNAIVGIVSAGPDSIQFTRDIRGLPNGKADGDADDANEDITYTFVNSQIVRNEASIPSQAAIAVNIDALDFVYLDGNGTVLNPNGTAVAAIDIGNIKTVQITVVARTERGDQGYRNQESYNNQNGVQLLGVQNDNFHRKCLTSNIRCRNL